MPRIVRPLLAALLLILLGALPAVAPIGCGEDAESGPIPPKREQRGRYTVVWLSGTPYEMGYQHGQLLHEELALAVEYINNDILLSQMVGLARKKGILDLAYSQSYPDLLEECRGLSDAAADIPFSMDQCLVLNFGDVLMEFILDGMPPEDPVTRALARRLQPGCSEIAVSGPATPDGRLYHGRILDWDEIEYILRFPTIFVRQPSDGIAHAFIGFPGNLSPYSGINAAGISVASNEAHVFDQTSHDRTGRSHVQMLAEVLKRCRTIEEATAFIQAQDHMTVELVMVADGNAGIARVFEMSAKAVGIRETDANGLVYATNHFLAPETRDHDSEPTRPANLLRFDRLAQLLEPAGPESLHGTLGPATLIRVMRDRVNPWDGTESPADVFDNGLSLATYGALFQIVFDPGAGTFWVAAGQIPVPLQPFEGFSIHELLGHGQPPVPARFE